MEQVKVSIRQEATLFIPFPLCKESRQNTNKNQKKKNAKNINLTHPHVKTLGLASWECLSSIFRFYYKGSLSARLVLKRKSYKHKVVFIKLHPKGLNSFVTGSCFYNTILIPSKEISCVLLWAFVWNLTRWRGGSAFKAQVYVEDPPWLVFPFPHCSVI